MLALITWGGFRRYSRHSAGLRMEIFTGLSKSITMQSILLHIHYHDVVDILARDTLHSFK
jgi:hypothetical protein